MTSLLHRFSSLIVNKDAAAPFSAVALERSHAAAQRAFAEGEFEEARNLAASTWSEVRNLLPALTPRPSTQFSIIIVTHRPSDAVWALLRKLVRYHGHDDRFEILFVNNSTERIRKHVQAIGHDIVCVDLGFNYGASGGRNAGAAIARGELLLFLDDDGDVDQETAGALIDAFSTEEVVAVRGRVTPKEAAGRSGQHYDLGLRPRPALVTTEGISAWRADVFRDFDGFDTLIHGHEGPLLCSRMYRFVGPLAFVYAPNAVLRHDFASSEATQALKLTKYAKNEDYINWLVPEYKQIVRRFYGGGPNQRAVGASGSMRRLPPPSGPLPPVSFITTARNGAGFVNEFVGALHRQTHKNFEVIFVDDGSTDGTVGKIKSAWGDDPRLRLIEQAPRGRGAALNTALDAASNDLCLIADVDDISARVRAAASARVLATRPELDCFCGHLYDEDRSHVVGRPHSPAALDFRVRRLFGMPASFPTFAFRKSRFPERFSTVLEGGIDCDWLVRNFRARPLAGELLPLHLVYYRRHPQQITATKREIQKAVGLKAAREAHSALLGPLSEADAASIGILSGWEPLHGDQLPETRRYVERLIDACPWPETTRAQMVAAFAGRLQELEVELRDRKIARLHKKVLSEPASTAKAGSLKTVRSEGAKDRAADGFQPIYSEGRALLEARRFEEARVMFERALMVKRSSRFARWGLAESLVGLGRTEEGTRLLETLAPISKDPGLQARLRRLKVDKERASPALPPLLARSVESADESAPRNV